MFFHSTNPGSTIRLPPETNQFASGLLSSQRESFLSHVGEARRAMVTGIVMASPSLGKTLVVASAQRTRITESAVNPYWGPQAQNALKRKRKLGQTGAVFIKLRLNQVGEKWREKMNEKRKWASKNFLSSYFILFQAILIKNLSIFSKHNTVSLIVYSYHSISMSRKDSKLSITSNLRTVIFRVSFKILKWHILNVLFG